MTDVSIRLQFTSSTGTCWGEFLRIEDNQIIVRKEDGSHIPVNCTDIVDEDIRFTDLNQS